MTRNQNLLIIILIVVFAFLIWPYQPKETKQAVDSIEKPSNKAVDSIEKPTNDSKPKKKQPVPKTVETPDRPVLPKRDNGALTDEEKAELQAAHDAKRNDYILISKFIDSEYIAKAVVKTTKMEKEITVLKKKLAETGIDPKNAGKYSDKIARLTALIEAEKLWEEYKNTFILYSKAYNNKEYKRTSELASILKGVQKKYKTLTGKTFPPIIPHFYTKYKDKLPELRVSISTK